jgi:hypothetical protein
MIKTYPLVIERRVWLRPTDRKVEQNPSGIENIDVIRNKETVQPTPLESTAAICM